MLLILHVIFASVSFVSMGLAVAAKWRFRERDFGYLVKLSEFTAAGLVITGAGLVIILHAGLQSVCLSGTVSLSALALLYGLYRRLSVPSS